MSIPSAGRSARSASQTGISMPGEWVFSATKLYDPIVMPVKPDPPIEERSPARPPMRGDKTLQQTPPGDLMETTGGSTGTVVEPPPALARWNFGALVLDVTFFAIGMAFLDF